MKRSHRTTYRRLFIALAASLVVLTATLLALAVAQIDLIGPPGSESFGGQVVVLPNGNIVVADPGHDASVAITDTGAVYLYNGATGALISQLTGSTTGDQVGSDIGVLSNGNYVVLSPNWDNGTVADVGAATWGNGTTGISGTVTIANSLVGSAMGDQVGNDLEALSNGNYVVQSTSWDNGATVDVGAATWGNGTTGITGVVSIINSLVGSTADDWVGTDLIALSNGNYVVISTQWDNGAMTNAGAVTWGNGLTGITGVVSNTNSLVGGSTNDLVGSYNIIVLSSGNYVVLSPNWSNGTAASAGAATWVNGMHGITGAVSSTNSLVGSAASDQIGSGLLVLRNGNYVVASSGWDNGAVANVGAATWVNGTTGLTGVVSITNSLVGSRANDQIGSHGLALSNGNYLMWSPTWDNGAVTNAGAATWVNGTTGLTGVVTITNSLVGSKANDRIGSGATALSNGNYVVLSTQWDNGTATDAGATTWGNGTQGITGVVTITNSLVGSRTNDRVGLGIWELSNGNYVVRSSFWDNDAATDAGAVTWANGISGITGVVTITNSLVGNTTNDQLGDSIVVLSNGNYVVRGPNWDNGTAVDAGAATWGNGMTGITGVVTISNSLVGNTTGDRVGDGVEALNNGNYVVYSPNWDNGAVADVGAATWVKGTTGLTGIVSITNSLVGGKTSDQVGFDVKTLNNGNYVVLSAQWDNGAAMNAGAVTWGNGTTGITGVVTSTNSLVGSVTDDRIGSELVELNNGNYVVKSSTWDNGVATDAGAVTWASGTSGLTGIVTSTNSLVGSTTDDGIGDSLAALNNGNYVVLSTRWDNGATTDSGAVTLGDGRTGAVGPITADNSVRGSAADGGSLLNFDYDYTHNQLVVGRPADNIVTLFRASHRVYLPLVRK